MKPPPPPRRPSGPPGQARGDLPGRSAQKGSDVGVPGPKAHKGRRVVSPPSPEATKAPPAKVPTPVSAPPVEASRVFGSESTGASEINQRREERRRSRVSAIRRHALRGVGIALAGAIVVWGIWFSPLFALRDGSISISAQSGEVDLEPVTEIVNRQIGVPLPSIKTGAVEEEILQNPKIATAWVVRDWPGGLDVVVTPRDPAFALKADKGYQLVGVDGVVIGNAKKVPKGVFVAQVEAEEVTAADAEKLLGLWDVLRKSVRSQVELVKLSGGQLSLELEDGGRVIWGQPSDSELKEEVLALLMEERPSEVYDVSDPTRPSVR